MTDSAKNDSDTGRASRPPNPAGRARVGRAERELPPLCYSVPEVCKMTGICRTKIYACFKSGALVKTKIGRRTVVLHEDLVAFLHNSRKPEGS
jgi:Helix-turn-helix domain